MADAPNIIENYKLILELKHAVSSIKGDVKALKSSDQKLFDADIELQRNINNLQSYLEKEIEKLGDEIMYNREQIVNLINNLNSKFQVLEERLSSLDNTLGNIKEVNESGFNTSIETQNLISSNIQVSSQKSEEGLKKVSSGVATVEILQSKAASNETNSAIERSIVEVKERFEQATKAVEEKKNLFDKHFNETMKGLRQELELISQHIIEIEKQNFDKLDELVSDLRGDRDEFEVSRKIQMERLENRSNTFGELTRGIEDQLVNLKRFQELRSKLEYFIKTDDSYYKQEILELSDSDSLGYVFPLHVINLAIDTKEVFGCEGKASTDSRMEFDDINKSTFEQIKKNLSSAEFEIDNLDVGSDLYEKLLSGLENLNNAGILDDNHFALINEHLESYSLKQVKY